VSGGIQVEMKTQPVAKIIKRKIKKYHSQEVVCAYLMLFPLLFGLSVFYIYPIFRTIFFSFTKWGAFGSYKITGIGNYVKLLHDHDMLLALKNTFIYTGLSVPLGLSAALIIAALLNSKIKGLSIYRALYFLPAITMPSAVAMVWNWIYNGDYGILNYCLSFFGIKGLGWVSDPSVAMYSLILVSVWGGIGISMIIFLAGLQGIPATYYEAASIDGAGAIKKFFKVTLPLLTPTIFFSLITSLIGSLQLFDLVFMMIRPGNLAMVNTQSIVYLFYRNAFVLNDKGYGAAISVVLLVITMIVTAIQFTFQKKWVNYD